MVVTTGVTLAREPGRMIPRHRLAIDKA